MKKKKLSPSSHFRHVGDGPRLHDVARARRHGRERDLPLGRDRAKHVLAADREIKPKGLRCELRDDPAREDAATAVLNIVDRLLLDGKN